MKNRRRIIGRSQSIFQRRGFYLALYSCIGVIMLASVVIIYSTLNLNNGKNDISELQLSLNDMKETSNNNVKGYTDIENSKSKTNKESISDNNLEKSTDITNNEENIYEEAKDKEILDSDQESENIISQEDTEENMKEISESEDKITEEKNKEDNKSKVEQPKNEKASVSKNFGEEDEMNWPVSGDIVMEYSPDKMVYDETLDQFRTNDTIKIAAKTGDKVRAAADGVVLDIKNNKEDGNTVLIDHGNGWVTTYTQLDDIKLSKGDVVSKGEIIANVSEPSIYSVALGSHIGFKVERENKSIDPSMILVSK